MTITTTPPAPSGAPDPFVLHLSEGTIVQLVGTLHCVTIRVTQQGRKYAVGKLAHLLGDIGVVVFPDEFEAHTALLERMEGDFGDKPVLTVTGRLTTWVDVQNPRPLGTSEIFVWTLEEQS